MRVRVQLDKLTALHCIAGDGGSAVSEANRFLRALRLRGLSTYTIRAYAYDLVAVYRWLKPPSRRVSKLCESDLLGFIDQQRQSGMCARTINRRLIVCRLLYRFLTDRDMDKGPGLSAPAGHYQGCGRDKYLGLYHLPKRRQLPLQVKVARTLVEPLQVEQIKTVLGTVKRYRDLAIIYLMLLCGLRSREVLTLRLTDLCLQDNRVRIHGKGNKERFLPLPQVLIKTLGDYLRLERPGQHDIDRLFLVLQGKRKGQPMTAAGLRSLFRHRRRHRPGITNANAHRFRHTFGTDMARAGVRLAVLQKMMGHANSTTTLQYVNLSMADIADEYLRTINQIQKRYRFPNKANR